MTIGQVNLILRTSIIVHCEGQESDKKHDNKVIIYFETKYEVKYD